MTFYIGMKVVCVDADGHWYDGERLEHNAIYTISAIGISFGVACIQVRELHRLPSKVDGEPRWGYDLNRFRPLVSDTRKVSFTEGAPKDSERWDNRKQKVKA